MATVTSDLAGGQPSDPPAASTDYRPVDALANSFRGADLAAQEEGSKGLLSNLTDAVQKGVPLVGAAIFNSFSNTAKEVGNALGGDFHMSTIQDEFGPDSSTTQYYQDHVGLVEGAGLAIGSLIPGVGAIKVMKLAQASGRLPAALQIATNLASGIRADTLAAASEDIIGNSAGGSLFGITNASKVKAVLAGVSEQALQGALYQTATLATMHASPLTDDNTLSDNLSDVRDAMLGFGVVGGIFEGAQAISQINRAQRAADFGTKAQELVASRGLGNITPGDRIVSLLQGLRDQPKPVNKLGAAKANFSSDTTMREVQDHLITAAGGDKELAQAFMGHITSGLADGSLHTGDNLTNLMGQLSRLGRWGDTSVASHSNDVFYLPRTIDPGRVGDILHPELLQRHPTDTALNSPAFTLNDPNTLPVIGRETETVILPSLQAGQQGVSFTKYSSAKEAHGAGVDIFLAANGKVMVNPLSSTMRVVPRPGESRTLTQAERKEVSKTGNLPAGAKPLNAVGMTLDLRTNKIFGDTPLPVVGDFAKPTLGQGGNLLRVGDELYPNKVGVDFQPTSPLEANARYVWAHLRGIKSGDAIHSQDLPMLEQLYRETLVDINVAMDKVGDTFSDGVKIPTSRDSLLQHIADVKQSRMIDMLQADRNADEIGITLNTPTSGITKMFNSTNPDELMIPPTSHMSVRHVRLAYDIGTTKDLEGNLLRGMQGVSYRAKLAQDANTHAVSNYLAQVVGSNDPTGKTAQQWFHALQFTKGAGDADILGAGAGFVKSAGAGYGTVAEQAARIGRSVSELLLKRSSIVNDTMASSLNALRGDAYASAEWGNFTAVRHSTGEHFVLLSDADAAIAGLPSGTAVLEGVAKRDKKTGAISWDTSYVPEGFIPGEPSLAGAPTATALGGAGSTSATKALRTYYTLSPKVLAVEKASQSLNNVRGSLRSSWYSAQGISKPAYNPDRLYAPPIDVSRYPFFAYIRQREGYAFGEGGAGIITAKDAQELQHKISLLGPDFDAFTDKGMKEYFSAKGEYDYSRGFGTSAVNTELARKGILNNIVPEARVENLINRLINWHTSSEAQLLRDHVELHNAQTFAQLKAMGDRFDLTGSSRKGFLSQEERRSINNPYQSYINTALDVGAMANYPFWFKAQDKLEAYANTAFDAVRNAFGASRKGLLPIEEAAKMSSRMGLGNPYGDLYGDMATAEKAYYGGLANKLAPSDVLRKFVATANSAIGATVIRLDTFQQLIHAVTLPIMASLEYGQASKELAQLLTVTVPGTKQAVPGFSRVMYRAIDNFFGPRSEELTQLYKGAGLPRDQLDVYREMINQLSLPLGKLSPEGWAQKIDKGASTAEKLTGSRFTNHFLHFAACDIGRQLGESLGFTGQDLLDHIGTFANRVLGNHAAGQRGAIFSGPVGQAIGLFQSYQMNLMQQLFRHIGDGNTRALLTAAGMQSSIFGLSSLPGFQALNSLIQDRHGNENHEDLYSGATDLAGKAAGDYLLYGGLSGLLNTALYSRGDLNPRRATILPVNPLNFPSVSAGIRVYQTLAQLGSNLTGGGDVPASLLLAAEHNGLSRPLTGLAELIQGYATNSKGDVIAQTRDPSAGYSDLFSLANFSRILGGRPLDEAVAMDSLYRSNAVTALNEARKQQLGEQARTSFYGNGDMSEEKTQRFLAEFVKAGGRQEDFNKWLLNLDTRANTVAVNRVFNSLSSRSSVYLQKTMGGQQLPEVRAPNDTTVSSDIYRSLLVGAQSSRRGLPNPSGAPLDPTGEPTY